MKLFIQAHKYEFEFLVLHLIVSCVLTNNALFKYIYLIALLNFFIFQIYKIVRVLCIKECIYAFDEVKIPYFDQKLSDVEEQSSSKLS